MNARQEAIREVIDALSNIKMDVPTNLSWQKQELFKAGARYVYDQFNVALIHVMRRAASDSSSHVKDSE